MKANRSPCPHSIPANQEYPFWQHPWVLSGHRKCAGGVIAPIFSFIDFVIWGNIHPKHRFMLFSEGQISLIPSVIEIYTICSWGRPKRSNSWDSSGVCDSIPVHSSQLSTRLGVFLVKGYSLPGVESPLGRWTGSCERCPGTGTCSAAGGTWRG